MAAEAVAALIVAGRLWGTFLGESVTTSHIPLPISPERDSCGESQLSQYEMRSKRLEHSDADTRQEAAEVTSRLLGLIHLFQLRGGRVKGCPWHGHQEAASASVHRGSARGPGEGRRTHQAREPVQNDLAADESSPQGRQRGTSPSRSEARAAPTDSPLPAGRVTTRRTFPTELPRPISTSILVDRVGARAADLV